MTTKKGKWREYWIPLDIDLSLSRSDGLHFH